MSKLRVGGGTDVGKIRAKNEDSLIVDESRGLYVVLDGMGGAHGGDIASQLGRDVIHEYVSQKRMIMPPPQMLDAAIQAATSAIFHAGQANRERQGMGTTVVAALVVDDTKVIVGHVGDSRAYLLRGGRLSILTRDHTIVDEMVGRGLLSANEAESHPYKNVLSRNLGSRPDAKVDITEVDLRPGDRLMLCSDGLYGYASQESIQYVLGSGDAPEHVARDLIELALRGGGGDNVTAIVIEAPPPAPSSTEVVRTSGAVAWWQRRQRFMAYAKEQGLARNPIVRGLPADEAIELVALSLCQAVFHDLEKSTGVNVWTFAQNLAGGWFERGGDWAALRAMMDLLGASARVVVDEIRAENIHLGFLLDIAVSRALVVAELALGGLLAERLRQVDGELISLHTAMQETIDQPVDEVAERFVDRPTIPFMRPERAVTNPGMSDDVVTAITKTITIARARTAPRAETIKQILGALELVATDAGGNFATAVLAARDIYGIRTVDDAGIMPVFDALDQARIITAAAVHQVQASDAVRARALRAISTAHQRLVGAMTGLVLEAVAPYSERLRAAQTLTGELRDAVAKTERKRADLEKRFATSADLSLPWGSRGNTEW